MSAVDIATGEIVPVAPTKPSEVAITGYLQQARDWLATAVEQTGPEQIAMAKAEIATAAEATKQLNLSREIREDAVEMVRRAEYALGKSIRKGQSEGTVATRGTRGGQTADCSLSNRVPAPSSFATNAELFGDQRGGGGNGILALADYADDAAFENAIEDAKAEGNLSRANVVRKVRATRKPPEKPKAPPKYGVRRKHAQILAVVIDQQLDGICLGLSEIEELDQSITEEEAARLADDLSKQIRSLNRIKTLLKERTK